MLIICGETIGSDVGDQHVCLCMINACKDEIHRNIWFIIYNKRDAIIFKKNRR